MADIINVGTSLPELEKKKTFERIKPGDEQTTETTAETPERVAADAAEGEIEAQQEATAQREAQLRGDAAGIRADDSNARVDALNHQQADQEFVLHSAAEDIAKARAATQARQAQLDAMDSPSLFGNTDTHGKVVRGVALALGGIGDAIQKAAMVRIGHAPPSIDTVGDIINGVLNQQREHIATLKDNVVRAKTGESDAREARSQMLADVDLRGAAMFKRLEAMATARLAAQGKTQEEINGDKNVLALREKLAERHTAHVEPLLRKIQEKVQGATVKSGGETTNRSPTASGAKPTESQTRDAFLGKNLASSLDIIEGLPAMTESQLGTAQDQELGMAAADKSASGGAVGNVVTKAGRTLGVIPRSQTEGLPPDAARSVNAGNIAKEMVARKLSGGSVVSDEDRQNAEKYMIHAGDPPALRAQKIATLRNMANQMLALSGEAGKTAAAATTAGASGGAAPKGDSARAAAISLVKARPNAPGSALLRKKFGITDAEVSP